MSETHMITSTGRAYDLVELGRHPVPPIEEIAHALAQINRFTGHAKRPYSVAEHSLLCADIARDRGGNERVQLGALLHDAHEALIGDVSSPMKRALGPEFEGFEREHEHAVQHALGVRGIFMSYAAEIKRCDLIALATERRDVMKWLGVVVDPWPVLDTPGQVIEPHPHERAGLWHEIRCNVTWYRWADAFLARYAALAPKAVG